MSPDEFSSLPPQHRASASRMINFKPSLIMVNCGTLRLSPLKTQLALWSNKSQGLDQKPDSFINPIISKNHD